MLSILIPTLHSRKAQFDALVEEFNRQIGLLGDGVNVEILYCCDNRQMTIGAKRQLLLTQCKTEYVVFFDDDDKPSADYVASIVEALKTKPDCVGFKGTMRANGGAVEHWEISHKHTVWHKKNGKYYRHTNHLTPVKTEIALKVGFKNMQNSEDYEYSMGLLPLLQTEVFINKDLYFYNYISNK